MLVTRKMDYGLRILLVLGCRPEARMTSDELSDIINVPRQFTLKIAQALTRKGIVRAQRGVGGGLELACSPDTLSLYDIFQATDTPRALNECLIDPAACTRAPYCAAHQGLIRVQGLLDRELRTITLSDLIKHQRIIDQEQNKQRREATAKE